MTLTEFDEGSASGPGLFVGGRFSEAGGMPADQIARWGCPPPTPCAADLGPSCGDWQVNINDLLILIGDWGKCGQGFCISDLDGNGIVNVNDLLSLIGAWGPCGN